VQQQGKEAFTGIYSELSGKLSVGVKVVAIVAAREGVFGERKEKR